MSEAPDILEGEWDQEQLNAFFDDLERGADVKHVQVRLGGGEGPAELSTTLTEAKGYCASGRAKAIQIRYEFDGQLWCDTLMFTDGSVRVIRTTLPGD